MRQIHELLRLNHQNQRSIREIARSCGLPTSTVGDYLKRAAAVGVQGPLPAGQSWFETLEKAHRLPLPATAFELAHWAKAKAPTTALTAAAGWAMLSASFGGVLVST